MLSQEEGDQRYFLKRGPTSIREKTFLKARSTGLTASSNPTTTYDSSPSTSSTNEIHAHLLFSEPYDPILGQLNPEITAFIKEEPVSGEESDASSTASYSDNLVLKLGKKQLIRGRTCMKCNEIINYEKRKEWESFTNHALHHTDYKSFHCLLCDFASHDGPEFYMHQREVHKFGGTVMLHPSCDNEADSLQLEQLILECFPGAKLRFTGVQERKKSARPGRGIERYLLTFDVITPQELERKKKTTVRCNRCGQFMNSIWSEQCLHALTHADFSQLKCSACSQKMTGPDHFQAHIEEVHENTGAKLVYRPIEDLSPEEMAKLEQLVCDIFSQNLLSTSSIVSKVENFNQKKVKERKVRCRKCRSETGMDWQAKCEHALLHTDLADAKCSDCDRRFPETADFLCHNVLAHQGKAKLTTKRLNELNREELSKVEGTAMSLYNDVLTIARRIEAEQDGKVTPEMATKRKRKSRAGWRKRKMEKMSQDVKSEGDSESELV